MIVIFEDNVSEVCISVSSHLNANTNNYKVTKGLGIVRQGFIIMLLPFLQK